MKGFLYFAHPGNLDMRTGGYGYDRRVIGALRDLGWDIKVLPLGDGFPDPTLQQLRHAEDVLSILPDGATVVVDGLAYGLLDTWASKQSIRLNLFALVHHPLALETGIAPRQRAKLLRHERAALSYAQGVVVTSHATARELRNNYDVMRSRIVVAHPGVDAAPLAIGTGNPARLLSVGSLTHRKGHDVLIASLCLLRDLPWICRIVGSEIMDPKVAGELDTMIGEALLRERVILAGEMENLSDEFDQADVFVLASRYEGYGMAFAEAMVRGLPVVGCAVGAVSEVVPQSAGILVEPNDPVSFADALRRLLVEPHTRSKMADAAAAVGRALPSWQETATKIAEFLDERT